MYHSSRQFNTPHLLAACLSLTLLAGGAQAATPEPDGAEACFRGIYALKAGDLDGAIAFYSTCIETGNLDQGNLIVALNDRGNAYGRRGDHRLALRDFGRIIRLAPDDPDAWYNRGLSHRRMNMLDEAMSDYSQTIALDPEYGKAFNNRGSLLGRKGLFNHAIEDFDRALELVPGSASAWFNRGLAHYSLGHYQQAILDFEQAIELAPDYGRAFEKLAWLKATCPEPGFRDGAEAIRLARKARILYGEGSSRLFDVLAAAHASAGRFDDALRYQQLAIEVSEQPPTAPRRLRLKRFEGQLHYEDSSGNQFVGES